MSGLSIAEGDFVICMDDDLQTPPREIIKLINYINEFDKDAVYGNYASKKHGFIRSFGTQMNDIMAYKLLGKPRKIQITSFFIMKRYVVNEIIKYKHSYPYIGGLLLRTTSNIGTVIVDHNERVYGKSNYNFKKLLSLWFNGFINFSVTPLRITSILGAIFAFWWVWVHVAYNNE